MHLQLARKETERRKQQLEEEKVCRQQAACVIQRAIQRQASRRKEMDEHLQREDSATKIQAIVRRHQVGSLMRCLTDVVDIKITPVIPFVYTWQCRTKYRKTRTSTIRRISTIQHVFR